MQDGKKREDKFIDKEENFPPGNSRDPKLNRDPTTHFLTFQTQQFSTEN